MLVHRTRQPACPVCGDGKCDKGEKCSQDCSKETYCDDGIDNDEDGLTDCKDDDCSGDPACAQPSGETDCNDGIDNDDNGLTDCADPECSGNSACIYEKLGKDRTHVDVQISNNNVTQFNGYGINLVGLAGATINNNILCNGTGKGISDSNNKANNYKNNSCDSSDPEGLCSLNCQGEPPAPECVPTEDCSDCGLCLGTPLPCEQFDNEQSCLSQQGCSWDSNKRFCYGEPTSCNKIGSEDCSSQQGCYIGGYSNDNGQTCYLDNNCIKECAPPGAPAPAPKIPPKIAIKAVDLKNLSTFDPDGDGKPNIVRVEIKDSPGKYRYVVNDDVILSGGKVYNIPAHSPAIQVNCSNCVFDCNGSTILGDGSGYGIENNGYDNVTVRNCVVEKYERGIFWHDGADNGRIENNTVNSNTVGIHLYSSSNNILIKNTANSNNKNGIYLSNSSNNILIDNTASNNGDFGIHLESSSSSNTLTNNTASSNNDDGIYLSSSSNNTLTDNTASNNGDFGIHLDSSSSNILTNNTATSNNIYGIYLSYSSSNPPIHQPIQPNLSHNH